jgi:hypothetical protein
MARIQRTNLHVTNIEALINDGSLEFTVGAIGTVCGPKRELHHRPRHSGPTERKNVNAEDLKPALHKQTRRLLEFRRE